MKFSSDVSLFSKLAGKCGNSEGFKMIVFFQSPALCTIWRKIHKKLCEILLFIERRWNFWTNAKKQVHIKTDSASSRQNITLLFFKMHKNIDKSVESVVLKAGFTIPEKSGRICSFSSISGKVWKSLEKSGI